MTGMGRRAFFKRGLKKASRTAVNYASDKANQRATQWIRPPFAIEELDFILGCDRCGDCISTCEYEVIFPLSANYGSSVINTPAMDLVNTACHLCKDWPCVTACKPAVLKLPGPDQVGNESDNIASVPGVVDIAPPKLALARISTESCLPYMGPECGACRSSCPVEGALSWDLAKPVINQDICCGCGLCRQACITEPSSVTIHKPARQKEKSV